MSKHTPGPWFTDDHETHWSILTAACQHIADVRQYTDGLNPLPEGEANAALISAAPDLLAVCEETAAFFDHFGIGEAAPGDGSFVGRVKAAIAKAKPE